MISVHKIFYSGLLCTVFTLGACATGNPPQASPSKPHKEDLSIYRIKYEILEEEEMDDVQVRNVEEETVDIASDVTEVLHDKLDAISEKNKSVKTVKGYRVLIYSGNSSEEAKKVKKTVYDFLPEENVYTTYRQPSFKVRVGDCLDRLEANYLLVQLKDEFPNALVVPDQINIE
ncbi:SPOR domain-containing protein [Cytophagaceae bacterium ABcell3]|nr:SPOR domain-containing protein [Cytophagaceae bacterium ABcell3]